MRDVDESRESPEAMLRELDALSLALARDLRRRALEVEDPGHATELVRLAAEVAAPCRAARVSDRR